MVIFLVRHGQSEANVAKIIQGSLDSPLTELGKQQALTLRSILPEYLDIIYSSPLSRCLETALLATGLEYGDSKIRLDQRLSEIHFGSLQGEKYEDFPADQDGVKKHIQFLNDSLNGKYGAELVLDFLHRTHDVFEFILSEIDTHSYQNVAIFSHGGTLRSISQHYLKLSDLRWTNCEYGILTHEDGMWTLNRYTDHLPS